MVRVACLIERERMTMNDRGHYGRHAPIVGIRDLPAQDQIKILSDFLKLLGSRPVQDDWWVIIEEGKGYGSGYSETTRLVKVTRGYFKDLNDAANAAGDALMQLDVPSQGKDLAARVAQQDQFTPSGSKTTTTLGTVKNVRAHLQHLVETLAQKGPAPAAPGPTPWYASWKIWAVSAAVVGGGVLLAGRTSR